MEQWYHETDTDKMEYGVRFEPKLLHVETFWNNKLHRNRYRKPANFPL